MIHGSAFPRPPLNQLFLSRFAQGNSETLFLPSVFSYSWLQESLPAWGSHLLTTARPSLQLAWAHTNATVRFLSAHCASHLAWLGDSLTSLSQRVSQRWGSEKARLAGASWEDAAPRGLLSPGILTPSLFHGPATDPAP